MNYKLAIIPLLVLSVCGFIRFPLNPVDVAATAVMPDDKSFFREIDTNDWPGDDISLKQFKTAVEHFSENDVCHHPWRWALVAPNTFLLKGTEYLLVREPHAGVPNVRFSHGYWGGETLGPSYMPILLAKQEVEAEAAKDCDFGVKP